MIPFSVTHLNFQYTEKLEELRSAYSQRNYVVTGNYRKWTNTGWQNSATDDVLPEDAVITSLFFATMQAFCYDYFGNFAPDLDYWQAFHAAEPYAASAAIVNNYNESNFRQFARDQVGGVMFDSTNNTAGFRWSKETELVDGSMRPIINVGGWIPPDEDGQMFETDYFGVEHILGQWIFEDLQAVFSRMAATAGNCSGIYGTPSMRMSGAEAYNTSSEHDPVWPILGLALTDEMVSPQDLVDHAKGELYTPTESSGFHIAAGTQYNITAEYKKGEDELPWLDKHLDYPPGTPFHFWASEVNIGWWAIGGNEILYAPAWLVGNWDLVSEVKIYHNTDGVESSLTSVALSYIDERIYLGSTFGSTAEPAAPTGLDQPDWDQVDWGVEPSPPPEPDPELELTDPDRYITLMQWYLGFVSKMDFYKEKYGGWGEKPGFAWGGFGSSSSTREYYGGLIKFNFVYGNEYTPEGLPYYTLDKCPITYIPFFPPTSPPCDLCDSCDSDQCNTCDGDACDSCDSDPCAVCDGGDIVCNCDYDCSCDSDIIPEECNCDYDCNCDSDEYCWCDYDEFCNSDYICSCDYDCSCDSDIIPEECNCDYDCNCDSDETCTCEGDTCPCDTDECDACDGDTCVFCDGGDSIL